MQQRDAEQACEAAGQQIGDARQSGEQSAAAQDQRVSSQPIGGMRDKRAGEHPNDHGGCKHKPDVLRLQSALAQQRRDKRRLHAERAVEQGVRGQK